MKTSKFDMSWQLARTQARKIKNVREKVKYVLDFLDDNPNVHNYVRVLNWLKMTMVAYRDEVMRRIFQSAILNIEQNKDKYSSESDNDVPFKKFSDEEISSVWKDLKKRKYGFQFKSVPKDHTSFMVELENEIKRRGL